MIPPAQQLTGGLGSSPAPANLAMHGQLVPRVQVTAAIVKDPEQLTRTLQAISNNLTNAANVASSNPVASSMTLRNLVSVNGVLVVSTRLGRAYQEWAVLRPRGGTVNVYEVSPQPAGLDATKQIALHCDAAGIVFDLRVA